MFEGSVTTSSFFSSFYSLCDIALFSERTETFLSGKGRGRQVIAVARTADMVIIMLDATKSDKQR